MSWKNKVVWSEGLFLRPQHFQQHDRYIESLVEGRAGPLRNHSWGFTSLAIDRDQLGIGKFAIATASGIFPDGTPLTFLTTHRRRRRSISTRKFAKRRSTWHCRYAASAASTSTIPRTQKASAAT